jgi:hypothetical protein
LVRWWSKPVPAVRRWSSTGPKPFRATVGVTA